MKPLTIISIRQQTWRHHLATLKRVMVTPAFRALHRNHIVSAAFVTEQKKRKKKKNRHKEGSLSTCDQQCTVDCQEHNRSWKGILRCEKISHYDGSQKQTLCVIVDKLHRMGFIDDYGLNLFKKIRSAYNYRLVYSHFGQDGTMRHTHATWRNRARQSLRNEDKDCKRLCALTQYGTHPLAR